MTKLIPVTIYRIIAPLIVVVTLAPDLTSAQSIHVSGQVTGDQREPAIALNDDGDYVIAWTSFDNQTDYSKVWVQRLNSSQGIIGQPFEVDATFTGDQFQPAIAINSDGAVIVAWTAHSDSTMLDVFFRVFDLTGEALTDATFANETKQSSQAAADVAVADGNSFLIAWHSWDQDGGDRGVIVRKFSSDGSPMSTEVLVNETTAYSQCYPAIGAAADGRFTVAWSGWIADTNSGWSYDVFARNFNQDGQPVTGEFQVNQYTDDNQWHVDAVVDSAGSPAFVWTSWGQDGDDGGIFARRFTNAGTAVTDEFQVNQTTLHYQWLPSISLDHSGDFIVSWSSWLQDGDREGIYYRFYGADGAARSNEFRLNDFVFSYQWEPAIALRNGDIVATWSSWGQAGDAYSVFSRQLTTSSVDLVARPVPNEIGVGEPYPNPFSAHTVIPYSLDEAENLRIDVLDPLGRTIATLFDGTQSPGNHELRWDAPALGSARPASGLYLIRIVAGNRTITRTAVRIR